MPVDLRQSKNWFASQNSGEGFLKFTLALDLLQSSFRTVLEFAVISIVGARTKFSIFERFIFG